MVVKVKESLEKTGHVKNNDKSKKYILRGQRNTRYHVYNCKLLTGYPMIYQTLL